MFIELKIYEIPKKYEQKHFVVNILEQIVFLKQILAAKLNDI